MLITRTHVSLLAGLFSIVSTEVIAADAGSIDQALKKQIQIENNEAPAETLIKKSEPKPKAASQSEVLIDVKGYRFTGMTLLQ